jgi:hypothetical protein
MKFEIRYPTGSIHTVEYNQTLVSVGRDPTCDVVLNDAKCSRRHAVIESGPTGLAVRDTGSANGVFLNGRKVERATLEDGDFLRLGEVIIKILAGESAGTVVVGNEELGPLAPAAPRPSAVLSTTQVDELPEGLPPRAGPPPQQVKTQPNPLGVDASPRVDSGRRAASPASASAEHRGPVPGPLTIRVLAGLWALGALTFAASGLVTAGALGWTTSGALAAALGGLILAAVAVVLALGLWSRSPWARPLQIALAALGILTCLFLPAAVTTLIYMLRAEVRAAFSGRKDLRELPPAEAEALATGSAEMAFTLSILGMVLLGLLLTALLTWLGLRRASR